VKPEAELVEVAPGEWKVVEQNVEPKPEWRHRCPKCKVREGEACVYLSTAQRWDMKWVTGAEGKKHRRSVQTILHRKGDTTERSHNERLVLLHRQTRPKPLQVVGPSPAVRALWAYDRREYHQMRAWLHANAGIFRIKENQ
jgi:hypothetical protein